MIPVINGDFFSFKKLGIVFVQTKPVKGSFLWVSVCLFKDNIMGEKVENRPTGSRKALRKSQGSKLKFSYLTQRLIKSRTYYKRHQELYKWPKVKWFEKFLSVLN